MEKSKLVLRSFLNSLGATAYIALVAIFLSNAQNIFGAEEKKIFLIPLAMLLLFVLSASVVGALILGKPILLYLDGEKRAGVKLFLHSVAWLLGFTLIAFFAISQL
ncbi:MAG: hypothetical protein ABSE68_00625 [Minisyncoccia bacterium]